MPKIAICIAYYNSSDFIGETLAGLANQTCKDINVYICADGSSAEELAILDQIIATHTLRPIITRIEYLPQVGSGHNKARAVSAALAGGAEYIQMVDSDDIPLPQMLEKNLAKIQSHDWVLCWGRLIGDRTGSVQGRIGTLSEEADRNLLHSWLMATAQTFREISYRDELLYAEDWDLWIRLFQAGKRGTIVKEELYGYRFHSRQLSAQLNDGNNEAYRKMRRDLRKLNGLPDRRYRFHLLGLVHLPCSREYMACAFTQKNYKLAQMLMSLGHEVIYYGAEGSDVPCTKMIQTHTLSDIRRAWGDGDNRFAIGYDWKTHEFRHDFNLEPREVTRKFYQATIESLKIEAQPSDFLLVTQGRYHQPVADAVPLYLTVEPGVGYRGSYCQFRAFESSYIQNFTYGSQFPYQSINGRYYDRVIPNYFDPRDFEFRATKDDYYLFIGRMILRKGVLTAAKVCNHLGQKLLIVGQGAIVLRDGSLQGMDEEFVLAPGNWEYLGFAEPEKRKQLMARAVGTFVSSEYLEPFAGTHVESMLSGTPPITTNFGVFPETIPDVLNGVVGFRCNTLQDFIHAAVRAPQVDHARIREHGLRFSMDRVKWEFQQWFDDLFQVYLSTLDTRTKGWHYIGKDDGD